MRRIQKWWFVLLVGLLGSCVTPDDLADQNGVLLFEVQHILSREVVLGEATILNDSSEIHIPLLYGNNLSPIELSCRIQLSAGARMLSLNSEQVSFAAGESELLFYVIAANGATRQWKLKLMLPDATLVEDLMAFKVTSYSPTESYLFAEGVVRMLDTMVLVVAPEVYFPITIIPELTLREGASVYRMEGEESMLFKSYDEEKKIYIQSKEGVITPWRIRLQRPEMITTNAGYGTPVWKAVSFDKNNLNYQCSEHVSLEVDAEHNKIWLVMPEGEMPDNGTAQVQLNYDLPSYVWQIGMHAGEHLEMALNGSGRRCYLYDMVRGTCKQWQVRLVSQDYYYGGFTRFVPLQNSPAEIELLIDSLVIDNAGGVVWLPYRGSAVHFPLTVRFDFDLVSDARLSGLTNGQTLLFRDTASVCTFLMTSGAEVARSWSLRLLHDGFNRQLAGVTQLEISSSNSALGKLMVNRFAEVDDANSEIRLIVTDWADDLPLTVNARLQLLPGTTLDTDGWNGTDVLQFTDYNDRYVVKTRSADGSLQKQYQVVLENRARRRSSETELIQFAVQGLSAGYGVNAIEIDATERVVTMQLAAVGSGALSFTPTWTLSAGAYVEGLQQGQPFLFGNLDRVYAFTIVSEDETVRSGWKLKVDASPQLENHDFEFWSDSYTVSGWASANSSFGKTMQRATHDDGYCVQLTTSTVLGNVAAGSLFLGYFQIDLSQLNNTRMMTYMGIPFVGRPTAMQVDLKYNANGGDDMGSCTIELLNYVGNNFEYHSIGNEAGVTVVARGEYQTGTTNGWQTVTVPLTTLNSALGVTHIHVIFSSSYRGDDLVGTIGATLSVDNVRLVY